MGFHDEGTSTRATDRYRLALSAEAMRTALPQCSTSELPYPVSMAISMGEKHRRRAAFLHRLYDITDGDTLRSELPANLGAVVADWTADEITQVAQHLRQRELVASQTLAGDLSLTPLGVDVVEESRSHSGRAIPPLGVPYSLVRDLVNQEPPSETARGPEPQPRVDSPERPKVEATGGILDAEARRLVWAWRSEFREALAQLEGDDAEEAEESLIRLEKELDRAEPKTSRIRRYVGSLQGIAWDVTKGAAGSALFALIATNADKLPIW